MGMNVGGSDELNSEINVTPMVDVMLVLLIIFMITAPIMTSGVAVDLPQTNAQKIEDPEGKLILSIDKDRKLFLGATPITWRELGAKLSSNERVKREQAIWVEADRTLPYAIVVTAMAIAKDAGIPRVQLLTDPATVMNLSELDGAAPAPGGGVP
ncbi:MAG: biopolymer transporter ExbD [Kofleriaceae bacterium]|jgi:biopolymer transport protein TolR|nr:biopolymer transporter ExbD [Kofleriaceae bacterium]MBP6838669.1 biopolymer transporter ExbD [Kofleriaceae bacterium]MBP9208362.1 biopolymer transporter ExbD [Kofleriaceae bacterium]